MEQKLFNEKYPIFELTLGKDECVYDSTAQLVDYFIGKIEAHPVAKYIAHFDHLTHTQSIQGEVLEGVIAAQHVIFCFGTKLPNPHVMAVRPRSIGITEFAEHFVINFMEPPMPVATEAMEGWVKALKK